MPEVASDILQALIDRGLVATGGNIRQIPFANSPAPDAQANGNGGTPTGLPPVAGGSVPRPEGPMPVIDAQNKLVDPNTGQEPPNVGDWWKYLFAGGAIAGGAALASLMRRRMGTSSIPTVEGEIIDPLSPAASPEIVNGEYSEVDAPRQLTREAPPIQGSSQPNALPETTQALTARNRATNPVVSSDTSVVRAGDALSDITPEELARAKELTDQLVANRMKGNAARAKQTNLTRRGGLPTGSVEEEGLLNTVIRLMRMAH